MIDIKSSVENQIIFDVSISGANVKDIQGRMVITKENIDYGFPVSIKEGKLIADLPSIDTVIPSLKNGDILESRIDIIANKDSYTEAWTDKIKIDKPVEIKATVNESIQKSNKVQVVVKEGSSISKKGKKLKNTPTVKKQVAQSKQPGPVVNIEEKLNSFLSKYNL